ncbi:cupredoxin domain-containing protein [Phenylobacterium sp.]|uniref:cupredoxin domain-containing protein n=1 Tax=Phenylobacterium sp. TaxID=1871053 RepID=UPI002DF66FA7|nr:cupredoxin domain-containing protein [Phenylobacterium sp.]
MMRLAAALVLIGVFGAGAALAEAPAEPVTVALTLKDHRFTPDRVSVPAGRTIRIELANRDAALEEFDSDDLHVEKDVTPLGKASFTVGPLKPGAYSFMGELHADTASGVLTATAP